MKLYFDITKKKSIRVEPYHGTSSRNLLSMIYDSGASFIISLDELNTRVKAGHYVAVG